ncbi:MAG: glycosyltransferase [Saprospiraceae bacterium]|nr:glycosyltransferase [Saprospiraceae bacterium]
MKVLFFTKIDFNIPATGGLFRKVKAQAKALAQTDGWTVDLFYIQGKEAILEKYDGTFERQTFGSSRQRAIYTNQGIFDLILAKGYDAIYMRHFLLNPVLIWHLWRWRKEQSHHRFILELPTYPYRPEFRDAPLKVKVQVWLDQFCFVFLPRIVDRIVTFSRLSRIRGIPTLETDNGVDPESITPILEAPPQPPFRILGLANLNIWHGYDRMIRGMAEWKLLNHTEKIRFEIAGSGKEEQNLRDLVNDLDVADIVTFHGFIQGAALDELIAQCHVGIASLGMHRTGVADGQTTTLKAREFAARGLPFLLGYKDHDFLEDYPYCLVVPANETPVDPRSVLAFYQDISGQDPVYFTTMRTDAQERLSWTAKLSPVVAYLETQKP